MLLVEPTPNDGGDTTGGPRCAPESLHRALTRERPQATGTAESPEAGQTEFEEARPPRADDFAAGAETARDSVIADAPGGAQDHPGGGDLKVWLCIAAGAATACSTLLLGHDDGEWALAPRYGPSARNRMPRKAGSREYGYVSKSTERSA